MDARFLQRLSGFGQASGDAHRGHGSPARGFFGPVVVAVLAVLLGAVFMAGFTVDDALISVGYARSLAAGHGYRLCASCAVSDGVTPLPWAFMLAPFGRLAPFTLLRVAQGMGVACALFCAVLVGLRAGRLAGLPATLGTCLPIAAYAVSGMETPVAMALCTGAVFCIHRPAWVAVLAGLSATLRPELAPWAMVLSFGATVLQKASVAAPAVLRATLASSLTLVPFVLCAAARAWFFGRPYPLALLAKPSDLSHGAVYVAAALVVSAGPILLLAPGRFRSPNRELAPAILVAVALLVHTGVVALVGGDWMPYGRLLVPVLPGLWLVAAPLVGGRWGTVRLAATGIIGAAFLIGAGREGRGVAAARIAVSQEFAKLGPGVGRTASVDVGWLSATIPDVLDLAGVTDLEIASLPGGHTSKRVDPAYLQGRGVRSVLVYVAGGTTGVLSPFRDVELRLVRDPEFLRRCAAAEFLPMAHTRSNRRHGYRLYRCAAQEP